MANAVALTVYPHNHSEVANRHALLSATHPLDEAPLTITPIVPWILDGSPQAVEPMTW